MTIAQQQYFFDYGIRRCYDSGRFGPEINPPFHWDSKHQTKNHRINKRYDFNAAIFNTIANKNVCCKHNALE